ncbi:MAG: fibronectin type III domain-containing protein [Dehalococcoidia bacterium]
MSQTRMPAVTWMRDHRTRIFATLGSWRFLLAAILVALSLAYLVPIERSLGLFTATHANGGTLSSGTLEPPVTLLANTVGVGQIKLDWPASPSAFATGYTVYRLDPGEPEYLPVITVLGHATTTYTDTGLAPASMFVYRVEAISGDWNSAPSDTAFAVTP